MPKFLISTSIAYVNADPHIGFAMELCQADALARYHRLKGDDTFFSTGTDEHGVKIYQTAKEKKMETQALVDLNAEKFERLCAALHISNDDFVRTTSERHRKGVLKIWKKLETAGDLYKGKYSGLYCVGCEAYVPEKDLADGLCPNHKRAPEYLEEENWFFRLSKYSAAIAHAVKTDELKIVPEIRKNEFLQMLKDGLPDISFSRPKTVLPWGIEVPGDPSHIMYVWPDALSNYLTTVEYENEGEPFRKFWPTDVNLIGKDILRFHAGIWIGMLMSINVPIPKNIYVHGFITSEGQKMSKSLGNTVDPFAYIDEFGSDALRYYLLREIPTCDDGDFSRERFTILYNTELADNLGNLVNRVAAMAEKYFPSGISEVAPDHEFSDRLKQFWKTYDEGFAAFDLKFSLETVMKVAEFGNKYVDTSRPWELQKKDPEALKKAMVSLLEVISTLGAMLQPFLPEASEKILNSLGGAKLPPLFMKTGR